MSDPRSRRTTLLALTAVLVLAALAWFVATLMDPPIDLASPTPSQRAEPAAPAAASSTAAAAPDGEAAAAERALVAVAPTQSASPETGVLLRVRLRGLHPDAPWVTKLQLQVARHGEHGQEVLEHQALAAVDTDGRAAFPAPLWWVTSTQHRAQILANDPLYMFLDHRWEGAVDTANEHVLDVQAVAILDGRVVDSRGAAVALARVCAYPIRDGVPMHEQIDATSTRGDGTWSMPAPAGVPLLLITQPRTVARPDSLWILPTGTSQSLDREPNLTLLPASGRTLGTVGPRTRVPDLVLHDASSVRGVVQWSDGAPVPGATVRAMPRGGTTFRLGGDLAVQLHDDGTMSPFTGTTSDARGQFTLTVAPGARLDAAIAALPNVAMLGDWPTQAVVPPQRVEFALPSPITLGVVHAGKPVPGSRIEVDGSAPDRVGVGATGTVAIVVLGKAPSVRAGHERLLSPWVVLAPELAGTTVTLELGEALGAVSIEFEGQFRVRNTTIEWRSTDGRVGREHLMRDDRGGPFQIFLEPGQYHLRVGPGGGERNGVYLLPAECDVEVISLPVRLVFPAVFGGSFVVMATDSSGLHVAGTCHVRDGEGKDQSDHFTGQDDGNQGRPGELMSGGPNSFSGILPPGDYELLFDFVGHGARRHRLTIKPREVTEVRVRL